MDSTRANSLDIEHVGHLWIYSTSCYVEETRNFDGADTMSTSPTVVMCWWNTSCIVYLRLHITNWMFYIGSTEQTMFLREQSRVWKFRQLAHDKLAYHEPALKVWAVQDNFFQFIVCPLVHAEPDKLLALETAHQRTTSVQLAMGQPVAEMITAWQTTVWTRFIEDDFSWYEIY